MNGFDLFQHSDPDPTKTSGSATLLSGLPSPLCKMKSGGEQGAARSNSFIEEKKLVINIRNLRKIFFSLTIALYFKLQINYFELIKFFLFLSF